MDSKDRALLALLRHDGRMSVTTLAGKLSLTRATVQVRLDRLLQSGTIRRFTIELDTGAPDATIRAIMLVELQGNLARTVTRSMRRIPEIADLHTTNGAWDLVAQIEANSLADFDRVLRDVREIRGVLNSETCLLLSRAEG